MVREVSAVMAAVVVAWCSSPAQAQDAAKGEQVFKRCQACHAVGADAKNKVGPPLNGVAGRKWATWPDFAYSQDLIQGRDGGKVWDDPTLTAYLENPKAVAPKGKMAFVGLKKEDERNDVIVYLKQFDESGAKK